MPTGNDSGFTLLEVIMVIVVVGIISVAAGSLLLQGTRSFEALDAERDLAGQGTLALERVSRELRLMRCTVSGVSCNPQAGDLVAMNPSEVRFINTDYEGKGFRLNAGALLLRRGSNPGDTEDALASNVSSLRFDYLKKDGAPAAAAPEVWTIAVTFTLSSGAQSLTLRASVHPRSFR